MQLDKIIYWMLLLFLFAWIYHIHVEVHNLKIEPTEKIIYHVKPKPVKIYKFGRIN